MTRDLLTAVDGPIYRVPDGRVEQRIASRFRMGGRKAAFLEFRITSFRDVVFPTRAPFLHCKSGSEASFPWMKTCLSRLTTSEVSLLARTTIRRCPEVKLATREKGGPNSRFLFL